MLKTLSEAKTPEEAFNMCLMLNEKAVEQRNIREGIRTEGSIIHTDESGCCSIGEDEESKMRKSCAIF